LLVAVMGLDHAQHDHSGPDPQRAAAGEIERAVAFRRVVYDDQEFWRVAGLVAAALLAHWPQSSRAARRRNLPRRSGAAQGGVQPDQSCGLPLSTRCETEVA